MNQPTPKPAPSIGVRLVGTGSALPAKHLTNADLEKVMDTSDEWIAQRTGIRQRRVIDRDRGETTHTLAAEAIRNALDDAGMDPGELDLIVVATMTPEMGCPPTACMVADAVGAGQIGAFDLGGACCGYVFALNVVHSLIRSGTHRSVALVGSDILTSLVDYSTQGRGTAILFGDAAAAAIFTATDDTSKGVLAQAMHSDGSHWSDIYVPHHRIHFPEGTEPDESRLHVVQMNGRTVFRFAVSTFPSLIEQTLAEAGLEANDIAQYVCHQSNARILKAARDRFGLPEDKLLINIDRYGNTVAASVPLCLDELRKDGRINPGDKVMFVAFGGGLTWASSLWQL